MTLDEKKLCDDSELMLAAGGSSGDEIQSLTYRHIKIYIDGGNDKPAIYEWRFHGDELSEEEKEQIRKLFFDRFAYEIDQKPSWD